MIRSEEVNKYIKYIDLHFRIQVEAFKVRPDVYFEHIWKNIFGYNDPVPLPTSTCYGCWVWDTVMAPKDKLNEVRDYLIGCYNNGHITAASW